MGKKATAALSWFASKLNRRSKHSSASSLSSANSLPEEVFDYDHSSSSSNSNNFLRAASSLPKDLESVEALCARKPGIAPRMWTAEEDKLLLDAVHRHGTKSWKLIAHEVKSRTHVQCLQRYQKVLRRDLVKGAWSADEDELLLQLMESHRDSSGEGYEWKRIAERITGRSAKQCRERWYLNLDPAINHGEWMEEEDNQLMELYLELGSSWTQISKRMPGRTENSVKTRFNSLMRREAKNRGWSNLDNYIFAATLLFYGKDFQIVHRVMLGRSKSQLKKHFNDLLLQTQNKQILQVLHYVAKNEGGMNSSSNCSVTIHDVEENLRTKFGVSWHERQNVTFDDVCACFKSEFTPNAVKTEHGYGNYASNLNKRVSAATLVDHGEYKEEDDYSVLDGTLTDDFLSTECENTVYGSTPPDHGYNNNSNVLQTGFAPIEGSFHLNHTNYYGEPMLDPLFCLEGNNVMQNGYNNYNHFSMPAAMNNYSMSVPTIFNTPVGGGYNLGNFNLNMNYSSAFGRKPSVNNMKPSDLNNNECNNMQNILY